MVVILAIMLTLFASVILLIVIRRKSKDSVQVSAAMALYEVERSSVELSRVSSLKEKSDLSEGSIHTETSIEKLEQNGSPTNAGTGQMNEYL